MWKERFNELLRRTIGHTLQRADPPPAAPAPLPGPDPSSAREVRDATAGPAPKQPARTARAKLPTHYDDEAKTIILRVGPRTPTGREKLFGLILAIRYVAEQDIPGDVVECGVGHGRSMQTAALALSATGDRMRHVHLFDDFGLSSPAAEPVPGDVEGPGGDAGTDLVDLSPAPTLAEVQEAMAGTDYPADHIHLHLGTVQKTIPAEAPDAIGLLRLANDSYEATRHELEHLYDRLSPGGVLIIDDYGRWDRARLATEEFIKQRDLRLLLLPLESGRVAVKPPA